MNETRLGQSAINLAYFVMPLSAIKILFGFCYISDDKTRVVLGSPSSIQILHCSTPLFTRLACQTTDRRQSWLLSSSTVLHGHGPLNIQKWRHERQRTTGERERGSCLPLPFKTLGKKEDCQGASLYYVWQIFELCNPLNPCSQICEIYFCMFSVDPSYTYVIYGNPIE